MSNENITTNACDNEISNLPSQLKQVEKAVGEMRDVFTKALNSLQTMNDDKLEKRVDSQQMQHESQLSQVVQMVLSLKNEFTSILHQLAVESHLQRDLKTQVLALTKDRLKLLDELHLSGAISDSLYNDQISYSLNFKDEPLSLLLQRARVIFGQSLKSDDSGVTTDLSESLKDNSYINMPPPPSPVDFMLSSDSECSITIAANKSLDLSRSLGDNCLELTAIEITTSDEDIENKKEKQLSNAERTAADGAPRSPYVKTLTPTFKRPPPHEQKIRDVKRHNVIQELYDTEKKYCNSLWILLDHFAESIRKSELISVKELTTMIPPTIMKLYQIHCKILQRLEERLSNKNKYQGMCGDIFARFIVDSNSNLFEIYEAYVRDYPDAIHQMKCSCQDSNVFETFFKELLSDPVCEGLDLISFLMTPIQRIPRYALMIKQILKYTENEHPDHYQLQASLDKLAVFLDKLNESIVYSANLVSQLFKQSPNLKRRNSQTSSFRSNSSVESMKAVASNTVQKLQRVAYNVSFRDRAPRIPKKVKETPNRLKEKFDGDILPSLNTTEQVLAGNFRRPRRSISQSDVRLVVEFNESKANTTVSQSEFDISNYSQKKLRFPSLAWFKHGKGISESESKKVPKKRPGSLQDSIVSEADTSLKRRNFKGLRNFFRKK